jgi:hypothetical protein
VPWGGNRCKRLAGIPFAAGGESPHAFPDSPD